MRISDWSSDVCSSDLEPTELLALSEAVVRELGFDRLALVHGLWFRRSSPNLIRLDNFGEYANIFIERRYYENDPAILACQRTNTVFPWTGIAGLIDIEDRHPLIFKEAKQHGLFCGFTLPVGVVSTDEGRLGKVGGR